MNTILWIISLGFTFVSAEQLLLNFSSFMGSNEGLKSNNPTNNLDKNFKHELQLIKRDFELQLTALNGKIEGLNNKINNNQKTCDSDWFTYSDRKCFKVLDKMGTQKEAKNTCNQLEGTLITIHSQKEQNFLSNLLENYKNISDNVWIGLELVNQTFKWNDEIELNYENWGQNALKVNYHKCVQMPLGKTELGQWIDDLCEKKYLIVCQRKQSSNAVISEDLIIMEKINKNLQEQITGLTKCVNSLLPLGFLYTQYPNQSSPQELWPQMNWSEVTSEYSGLFFRAEGEGSETFGVIQHANQSWISDSYCYSTHHYKSEINVFGNRNLDAYTSSLTKGKWTSLKNGERRVCDTFNLFTTDGEVRPRNSAVKIWKRIQ